MFDQIQLEETLTMQKYEGRTRRLAFSGAQNFRDLGGYKTEDGRTVRWGLLYRSDALSKLTQTDLKFIAALNLNRIIDFRSGHEKEAEPNRFPPATTTRYIEIPILDSSTRVWHESREEFIKSLKKLDAAHYMKETNTEFITRFTPEFRKFFLELLAASGRPVLFHCAAGKDRTGFAAAVILRMLGVPLETVMEDYLLSNQYFLKSYQWRLTVIRLMRGNRAANIAKGFMEVSPSYLMSAFVAISNEYGSFENYLYTGLELSERDIKRFKNLYLG